jgi:DNA-directed RNA polymerase subunit RPC12/RpoP
MFDLDDFLGLNNTTTKQQFVKQQINYMSFKKPGIYTVRVLEKFEPIYVHYLPHQNLSILCLGPECPICQRNSYLFNQYDKLAPKQKEFIAKQTRYVANVLDRTPSYACTGCGATYYNFEIKKGTACPACGTTITSNPVPLDVVKLASFSKTFVEQLKVVAQSVMNGDGEVVPLVSYDLQIVSAVVEGKTRISCYPGQIDKPIEVPEDSLFPHNKIAMKFSKEEVVQILSGTNYKDVLRARDEATRQQNETSIVGGSLEMSDSISQEAEQVVTAIKELFGD